MAIVILIIYFGILISFQPKTLNVTTIILSIIGISLICALFTGRNYPVTHLITGINLIVTLLILTILTLAWSKFDRISTISCNNEKKLNKVTKIIIWISVIPFVIFLITSILLYQTTEDINIFKYAEGAALEFYYTRLPFDVRLFILSTYLCKLSYLLIPLHFYYLSKGDNKYSILCFILSLTVVLHGVAFFSRAVFAHYFLIYIAMYTISINCLTYETKKRLRKYAILLGSLFLIYFIYISIERFDNNESYSFTIPKESIIKDPLLYSYFDYISQWYYNSIYVLDAYNFQTFNFQTSLNPILDLLGHYNLIDYDYSEYKILRQKLWPEHWFTFNGVVAYFIYDFGYIISIIISIIYFFYVRKFIKKKGTLSINNFLIIVSLIQIPLMSIFYSTIAEIIIILLLTFPILCYLSPSKIKIK